MDDPHVAVPSRAWPQLKSQEEQQQPSMYLLLMRYSKLKSQQQEQQPSAYY